jgi:hypothetical protein
VVGGLGGHKGCTGKHQQHRYVSTCIR